MQIISGLRRAGHKVTFSMPLDGYLGKTNLNRVRPLLSKEELWASEHYFEHDVVLNRIQPDIAITCNVNTFRTPPTFSKDVIQILDLYGPLQFEGLLLDNPDYQEAMMSGPMLEDRCKEMVKSFRSVDYVVTVSERQKYFWSAYCTLAGFSFAELNLLICPAAFDVPSVQRQPSAQLSAVYAGGFYPWQSPNRFLEKTAAILERFEGATLHVFGGPHAGLINEEEVKTFLKDLQRFRSVRYHGYRPVEEVVSQLSRAWCALELMDRNIERELAITGRTIEFLSTGTPVIYNNYSTLSGLIEKYHAGWTVPTEDESALEPIFTDLMERGVGFVEELSANARKLAANEFSAEKSIAPLAKLCGSPELRKRASKTSTRPHRAANSRSLGRVLVISTDSGALLDLRVRNPLRALHRQGLIDGMTISSVYLPHLQHDHNAYDVIVTQRALPQPVYDLLEGMSLAFVADVDDNLLARACYRTEDPEFSIASGLRGCTAFTAPNPRLVRALERYAGLALAHKSFITPNALPFAGDQRPARPPSQMIWIQSDIAALEQSREAVVTAVDAFSNKYELPIVLIGKNVLSRPQFRRQIVMGEIDFTSNLQLLAEAPLSIGIAPLETQSDPETLDFVAGKSDLKILLFAGYGHAGVYSAATPYTDSNLQDGLSLVANSEAEWSEALEYEFREGWKTMAAKAGRIQSERTVDKIARENWVPALEAARLSRPVTGAALYEGLRSSLEMGNTPTQSLAYLLANEDVLLECMQNGNYTAWKHYEEYGRGERRQLRHSLRAQSEVMDRIGRESADALAQASARIAALQDKVSILRKQKTRVAALRDELKRLREENNRAAELANQSRDQDEKSQVDALRNELGELQEEKNRIEKILSGVLHSTSWRLTAPVRALRQRTRRE